MSPKRYLKIIRTETRCSVCYKETAIEPHHIDQIGMGRNRNNELIEHFSAIPVCRPCHQEYHHIGKRRFEEKNNVNCYEIAYDYLSKYIFYEFNGRL
jgi:hypothetical protein